MATQASVMGFSNLADLLYRAARTWPQKHAVVSSTPAFALTYLELETLAAKLGDRVRQLGLRQGRVAAIVSDNSIELVLALFAIASSGAAAVFVAPGLSPSETAARCAAAGAVAAIVPDRLDVRFDGSTVAPPIWKLAFEVSSGTPRATIDGSAAKELGP